MARNTTAPLSLPTADRYALAPRIVMGPQGPLHNTVIIVEAGRITHVGPADAIPETYADIAITKLPDSVVMPGLIDAHNHITQAFTKGVSAGEPAQLWKRMWIPLSASMSAEDYYRSAKWTATELLRGGITTVAVSGEPSDDRGKAALEGMLSAGIRIVFGFGFADLADFESQSKLVGTPPGTDKALAAAAAVMSEIPANPRLTVSLAAGTVHTATVELLQGLSLMAQAEGVLFQFHANEHTPEVEFSLDRYGLRPVELLAEHGILGEHVLLAHCTLVTPHERRILAETDTAVSYNPVASAWKGNAVAPALDFVAQSIRVGLGTDATRSDGFRLLDAAESAQRIAHSMAVDDFKAGGGQLWVDLGTRGGADVVGLAGVTGSIEQGQKADFLVLDAATLETAPSWDVAWEIVRYFDKSSLQGVYVEGELVIQAGQSTRFDIDEFMRTEVQAGHRSVGRAAMHKVNNPDALRVAASVGP